MLQSRFTLVQQQPATLYALQLVCPCPLFKQVIHALIIKHQRSSRTTFAWIEGALFFLRAAGARGGLVLLLCFIIHTHQQRIQREEHART